MAPSNPNQSQIDKPSRLRLRKGIVGGFVIPCAEARARFKRVHDVDISDDHSEDLNILWYMENYIHERVFSNSIDLVQCQDASPFDFLLVTQRAYGQFLNTGPPWVEEVLQDDLKDTLKPGVEEERARAVLRREFGR